MRKIQQILRAVLAVLAMASLALGVPPGSQLTVDGPVNLHGDATLDPAIYPTATNRIPEDNPPFQYQAPSLTEGTDSSSAMPATLNLNVTGNPEVYHYAATSHASPSLTFSGGGTVYIHIKGNLTLGSDGGSGGSITINGGTKVIFFVDGTTLFKYVDATQSGGSRLQIQGAGDVTIRALKVTGAAFANQTLTLDTNGGPLNGRIMMDAGASKATQEGKRYLEVLPIVEIGE